MVESQPIRGLHPRQPRLASLALTGSHRGLIALITAFLVSGEETGIFNHCSGCPELGVNRAISRSRRNLHRHGGAGGIVHLASQGAPEDEVVQFPFARIEFAFQTRGQLELLPRGADSFVSLLSPFRLCFVNSGFGGYCILAEAAHRQGPSRGNSLFRQVDRVGTHIGDVAVFVQRLCHAHRVSRVQP